MKAAVLVAIGCLAAGESRGFAQTANCTLQDDPDRTVNISNRGTQFETWFITDPVIDCDGGRHIVARQATFAVGAGQITLNGSVRVDDPDRSLTSEFAQYFTETRQLHARTGVVLTAKQTGSVITSELLDVYQQSPQRPEGLVIATGGSPRARLYQAREDGGRDSTIVDAREIRIIGEQSFRGTGDAVMRRDSLTATGQAIDYAQATDRLDVTGSARVQLPSQDLRGDSITATVDDSDEIRDVLARRGAALHADDIDVVAPAIRLLFEDGAIARLVAMPWDGVGGDAQPSVDSEQFRLRADSIDVLAPDQQITAAVAVGNAFGERIIPDSLRGLLPEAAPEVLALLSSDWMRGDTVRARFAPNPRAQVDSTADATVMEQLSAQGDQAQSMYSVRNDDDPAAKLSFNYLVSSYIEVNFVDGLVSTVSAAGNARGVYIQPAEAARAASGAIGAVDPARRR